MSKATIYIDPDDDITGIIEQVAGSPESIVAVVLPKRAQVLQSSVNMRLLKRASENASKKLVLISSEASITKLAGDVGIHVAKSLTSKPTIPKAASADDEEDLVIEDDNADDAVPDTSKSIGALAGLPVEKPAPEMPVERQITASSVDLDIDDDTIELDNVETSDDSNDVIPKESKKEKRDKKLVIPSFDKFRLRLIIAIFLIGLISVGLFMALVVMPKATITIKTQTDDLTTKVDFVADTAAKTVDEKNKIVPATTKTIKQTLTQKVTPTGQKDNGNKATGSVSLTNCINDGNPHTVPAGTMFSHNGLNFTLNSDVKLDAAVFSGSKCRSAELGFAREGNVTAQAGGDKYNFATTSYNSPIDGIYAYGSNMTGGTTKLVTVVSQDDIDNTKQTLLTNDSADKHKQDLTTQIKALNQLPVDTSYASLGATATANPAVGTEATEATITVEASYSMVGVDKSSLGKLLATAQASQIKKATQKIYKDGVDAGKIQPGEKKSDTQTAMIFTTTGTVGPKLDAASIAKDVAGKTGGETKSLIMARPGISAVDVSYSPFWVLKTPTSVKKITVKFDGTAVQ